MESSGHVQFQNFFSGGDIDEVFPANAFIALLRFLHWSLEVLETDQENELLLK